MKPRVLFVDQSGELGGAELYLLDVAAHFRHRSRVVLFQEGPFYERLMARGVDTEIMKAPPELLHVTKQGWEGIKAVPTIAGMAWRLAQMARSYDLLYANSQKALVVTALAGWIASRPTIWNLHDMLTADHFSRLNRWVAIGLANAFVSRVIVNSRATQEAFAAGGGQVEKSAVVYNGIDADRFDDVSPERVHDLRRTFEPGGDCLVGVFSRLSPWKGQHVLLRALAELPNVKAIIVGDALFDADEKYRHHLCALVQTLDIADRVEFLGFRNDIPALMRMVDITAHTSTAPEPFGRVVVEGMLARTPVIASRAGGPREVIDHGETGLLVPPADPSALADAIRKLRREPDTAARLARNARRAAEKRFSVPAMLEAIEGHVDEVARPVG